MKTFSVILPVYNAEETLALCLSSLTAQTFADYEIIAVDDGSTDASPAMLQAFAAAHPCLRVLTQHNQGQSVARNRAIREAEGEWLVFVDADDYVDTNYLQRLSDLLQQAQIGQADVVQLQGAYYHATAPWTRLLRRAWITTNAITFPEEMRAYEDVIFSLQLWAKRPRHVAVPAEGYHYTVCETSNSRSAANAQREQLYRAILRGNGAPLWLRLYTFIRIYSHFLKTP